MKKLVVIILVLCSATTGCNHEDTRPVKMGRRPAAMRFSGDEWTACCSDPADAQRSCDDAISSREQAVALMLARRNCTDKAIYALGGFARVDPAAKNDLAAAYYLRYKRAGQPIDLLHSLDALEGADTPEATFNRAIALEELALPADAIEAWKRVEDMKEPQWRDEAAAHLTALRRTASVDAATLWASRRAQLPALLARGDRAGVAAIVNEFPFSSQRYFEDDLLTAQPAAARLMAEELSKRLGNDPFDLDIVKRIETATPAQREVLRKAQLTFHEARAFGQAMRFGEAREPYEQAAKQFASVSSPMQLLASMEFAALSKADDKSIARVTRIKDEAKRHGYKHLAARCDGTLSYLFHYSSRFFESIRAVDDALTAYSGLGDHEGKAIMAVSTSGELRTIGQFEQSWKFALDSVRSIPNLVDSRRRHAALGDAGETASTLGFPRIALIYRNAAIRALESELAATLDPTQITDRRKQLGMAFRHRAETEALLEQMPAAQRDLNEAQRLRGDDDKAALGIAAHIEELNGRIALTSNPAEAVKSFTRAIELVKESEYRTFRASLYAQRAAAWRRQNRSVDAEHDLQAAVGALREEQKGILEHRTDASEKFWSSYFSRSQETYRQLIAQLLEDGDLARAFLYTENARGSEPLDLVRSRSTAPQSFRNLIKNDDVASLDDIRKHLEPETFLFEYCVLDDDNTAVWILSRDGVQYAMLPIGRRRLKNYSDRAQNGDADEFATVLLAQYDALIAKPMSIAARMNGDRLPKRLVISPDGPMHGLALAASRSNAGNRPYLIEQMPVEIAGSSTLYLLSLLRDRELRNDRRASVLLVGDPAFNEKLPQANKLERLPGAQDEIGKLSGMYAPGATELQGADATIPQFVALARQSAIIHIAAHAVVDPHASARSVILFAPSEGSSGALDAEELLNKLKLDRTRVVVLAACSSAGGLPVGPEGVAPLVRPLIAAGASAVVGTLWSVPDNATTTGLLVSFHQHYLEGKDAAVALQLAQQTVLRHGREKSWAAFQVIGHSSSPFAARTQTKEKPP